MPAIAGLRGSGDFSTDERPKDFREMIMWRSQRGVAPLTALMSRAKKSKVADPEFSWWDEAQAIVRLQVNGALAAADTLVTVDSPDPTDTNADRVYGTATNLVPGDLLLVEKATETTTYDNEIIEVVQVLSATQFIVKRGQAGSSAGSIANDVFLLRIGSAFAEGTAEPKSASRNPVKFYNYCQIFKTAYELTGTTMAISNLRTGDALANDKKRRMWDHATNLEHALIFGRRSETVGENGKPKRTTAGIRALLPSSRVKIYSAAVTAFDLLDDLYKMFDYETGAGDERIGFCGNGALNELQKIVMASGDLTWGNVVNAYGFDFQELRLPQGRIFFRTHPLFNQHSLYTKSILCVDFDALRWRHTAGRDTHPQDNLQNKGEDVRRGQWFTEGGLELNYAGLTCQYLGNISAT